MVPINETTLGLIFAGIAVISTVVYYGILGAGVKSLWEVNKALSNTESDQDPLDVLRDRYARGELSDEEFERKTERLMHTDPREREDEPHEREN